MEYFPIKTIIAYVLIWTGWLFSHEAMLNHQEYLIKLDDLLYNNCTPTTEFPFCPREFSDYNMI